MKKSLGEVIKENIPEKNPKQHKNWVNIEILDLMEERRKSKNEKEKYKELNKEIRKKCNEAKELWLNQQCQEIEKNNNMDGKLMNSKINDISRKKTKLRWPRKPY